MTRIAIVAESEELRGALFEALRDSPAFEVVSASSSADAIAASADVVVLARPARAQQRTSAPVAGDERAAPALTNREREILALLADGLGNKQIAARLGISTSTVKTHVEVLFEKLSVTSRAEAVGAAVRAGWLFL